MMAASSNRSGGPPEICFMNACELIGLIAARQISAHETMQAFLRQINRINPKVNAIVAKLDDEKSLSLARDADARAAKGDRIGPLHGIPFAFKDMHAAVGFPFTRGSPVYKHDYPSEDALLVERLRAAGV